MKDFVIMLAARSPSARMWYPFLALFIFACVVNGAWQAGLENAVISDAKAQEEVKSIVKYVPDAQIQIKALSEIRI